MNQSLISFESCQGQKFVTTCVDFENIATFEYVPNENNFHEDGDALDLALYFIQDLQTLITVFKTGILSFSFISFFFNKAIDFSRIS